MKFPQYVHPAVRQYVTALLEGKDGATGWLAVKDDPAHEWIAKIVTFLQRFGKQDEIIEEMFGHLNDAGFSDNEYKRFMNAAWASLTNYAKFRNNVIEAKELNREIATTARELARLLGSIQGRCLDDLPMEFYDVRTLLRETDNPSDLTWWGVNKDNLTGGPAGENALYAWGIAPSLADLLRTVAKAADNYEPRYFGRIGAAIQKRERNNKTEFIRAFGHELQAEIDFTPSVIHAIALMATVALNDNDIDVSSDDVRQALGLKGVG